MNDANISQKIVLLGCGSIGSKIGLHLGRAGFGNFSFVDNEQMAPHNLARHALVTGEPLAEPNFKAEQMRIAFQTLSHPDSTAHDIDITTALRSPADFSEIVPESTSLIIDATASLAVLTAATISSPLDASSARLARSVMYGQGSCSVLLLEGCDRSPRVDDLTASLFNRCRFNPQLRQSIEGITTDPTRLFIGDNCRSMTMRMTDSTVSRAAAMNAMQIENWLTTSLPSGGVICVGIGDQSGVGMSWNVYDEAPTVVLQSLAPDAWTIRVLANVMTSINNDVSKWLPSETGGALLGVVCHGTRTITIAGIVEAPSDSVRLPNRFVLGVAGQTQALQTAHQHSVGHLRFIGTWHSHPMGGSHSAIDKNTLTAIADIARGEPVVSLIWSPENIYCAVERI